MIEYAIENNFEDEYSQIFEFVKESKLPLDMLIKHAPESSPDSNSANLYDFIVSDEQGYIDHWGILLKDFIMDIQPAMHMKWAIHCLCHAFQSWDEKAIEGLRDYATGKEKYYNMMDEYFSKL